MRVRLLVISAVAVAVTSCGSGEENADVTSRSGGLDLVEAGKLTLLSTASSWSPFLAI